MDGTMPPRGGQAAAVAALQPPPELRARSERTRPLARDAVLPRISLELSRRCNLSCLFCYAKASPEHDGGLDDGEVRAVIDEAVDLGATAISIVGGGETLLRRSLLLDGRSAIDYANELGCYCYLYTNGTLIDRRAARWLARRDVSVVGKLLSLRDPVQDALVGIRGASARMRRGIDALLEAGFGGYGARRFALECVITTMNYDDLPSLWRFMRARGIVPEVEIPTPQGRAVDHRQALLFDEREAPEKYRQLFDELLRIDRAEFGYDWIPHPPFVAGTCLLYYSNCYVNERGGVQPCASVDREYGQLRVGPRRGEGQPLADVLRSPAFAKLRRIHEHLKGACRGCDLGATCYGCRAAAWHTAGDLFGEDPTCWRRRAQAAAQPGQLGPTARAGSAETPHGIAPCPDSRP